MLPGSLCSPAAETVQYCQGDCAILLESLQCCWEVCEMLLGRLCNAAREILESCWGVFTILLVSIPQFRGKHCTASLTVLHSLTSSIAQSA